MKIMIISAISKKNNPYVMLAVDLGYCLKPLTFDVNLIAEVCETSVRDIRELPVGKYNPDTLEEVN